jgi:hypothetical protein
MIDTQYMSLLYSVAVGLRFLTVALAADSVDVELLTIPDETMAGELVAATVNTFITVCACISISRANKHRSKVAVLSANASANRNKCHHTREFTSSPVVKPLPCI